MTPLTITSNFLAKLIVIRLTRIPVALFVHSPSRTTVVRVDHLPGSRKKKVNSSLPSAKRFRRYPAVLIGRLGVNINFADKGIGSELMDILKMWSILPDNKAACRFLAVDSYNQSRTIHYYQKNGFDFLFSTEEQEADNAAIDLPLTTRYMYFDLINVVN